VGVLAELRGVVAAELAESLPPCGQRRFPSTVSESASSAGRPQKPSMVKKIKPRKPSMVKKIKPRKPSMVKKIKPRKPSMVKKIKPMSRCCHCSQ
jgi:hypothetical protein